MKINIKARLRNKAFVITMTTMVIAFVYQILGMLDIVPKVSEDSITSIVMIVVNVLGAMGILIDPTTQGINDSDRAMTYYTERDERENE